MIPAWRCAIVGLGILVKASEECSSSECPSSHANDPTFLQMHLSLGSTVEIGAAEEADVKSSLNESVGANLTGKADGSASLSDFDKPKIVSVGTNITGKPEADASLTEFFKLKNAAHKRWHGTGSSTSHAKMADVLKNKIEDHTKATGITEGLAGLAHFIKSKFADHKKSSDGANTTGNATGNASVADELPVLVVDESNFSQLMHDLTATKIDMTLAEVVAKQFEQCLQRVVIAQHEVEEAKAQCPRRCGK
mmetsp:Transcript_15282/g.36176  ORF Transcript_15282/g.36176 Transcript_15282/m.36176 type:complete len:251 (+) Transcript_15282:55-807(+)